LLQNGEIISYVPGEATRLRRSFDKIETGASARVIGQRVPEAADFSYHAIAVSIFSAH
jgi:hypothetical protein